MNNYSKIQTVFKRDPKTKFKTLLMGQYSIPEFEYLENNIWEWQEKVDGCLQYSQEIMTDRGLIQIGRIVENKLPLNVLSYNKDLDVIEYKKIKYYHKEERLREFLSVKVRSRNRGNRLKKIVCTDNHKFFSNGKWVQAKNLRAGSTISHFNKNRLPYELKQVILGGLLGIVQ